MTLPSPALGSTLADVPWQYVDHTVAHWFRAHLGPVSGYVLQVLSGPGSPLCVAIVITIAIAFLVWKRRWVALLTLVLTVPVGAVLGELLKLAVHRTRPYLEGPGGAWGGYSFPSGHTLAATLLYGMLALVLARLPNRRFVFRWPYLLAAPLVLGVAFSRIALGAHYVTDVVAAMLLGSAWLMLCWRMVPALRRTRAAVPVPAPSEVHA